MTSFHSTRLFIFLSLMLCTLLACGVSPTSLPATIPATLTRIPAVGPTAAPMLPTPMLTLPSPGSDLRQPASVMARPQVSLRADLDYAAHRVWVQETITYPNRTGVVLPHLAFDVLAARRPSVFALTGGNVQGDSSATFTLKGTALQVALSQPLAADAVAVVAVEYTLDLPSIPREADGTTGTLGWSAHQTNLGDWFPAVSAYRDGWAAERNPPHVVGETTAPEAVDITMDLSVSNAPDGLQVIAGAPMEKVDGHYRFGLTGARSFALSLSTDYEIVQATTASGVLVRSAYFRRHAAAGRAALQTAAAALEVYGTHLGPYRYRQLSLVEADFSDGIEYSGFYFLGGSYYAEYDGTPRNYLTAIAAHEAAHQWWYDEVGNDQAREPWLDEALSTSSELVYYQATHPDLVNWWWNFRVTRFKPMGWVDSSVYDFSAFRPYVNAVYLRGALFLRDLRAAMGDVAFFDFLQRYRAAQSGRVATSNDFWSLLETYNVPNLTQLRAEYFAPLPSPMRTPVAQSFRATPDPEQSSACTRPPDDTTRVQVDGQTVNARTLWMLKLAQHLYGGPGSILRVVQGSYAPGLPESFGTHDGGGAVDISIRNQANLDQVLWDEAPKMAIAMRQAGFAAWYRPAGMLGPGSSAHIHAIAVGDLELSEAARRQLDGPEGYFRGLDGVPAEYKGPHPDPHGGPVICPWMIELGYKDLR
jgi:hypothetical protein